jgi:pimeloyl-ACP methyl ester carboxylesterase
MEQIEAAVGEDDLLSGRLEAARLLCDGIARMDRHVWNLQSVSIASRSVRLLLAVVLILVLFGAAVAYERLPGQRESGTFDTNPPAPYFHYTPAGSSRGRILAVHGLNASKNVLNILAYALSDAGFEVFTIDMPGHGDSGTAFNALRARDAVDQVFERLAPDTVLGHSLGGSLLLDVMHERHVKNMVLFSPAPVPLESIQADRMLVLVGQFDPPLLRSFAVQMNRDHTGSVDIRDLARVGHSGGYTRPWVIEDVIVWLGGQTNRGHTRSRLTLLALMMASGIGAGLSLLRMAPSTAIPEKPATPTHVRVLHYVIAALLSALLLAVVDVASWVGFFTTDYLVGFIFVTGVALALSSRPQWTTSARNVLIALLASAYVIALAHWAVSELAHVALTETRWRRFPLVVALGLPLFIADEFLLRPIPSRWSATVIAFTTRLLLAAIAVSGVLILNRRSGFLVIVAPLITMFWMALWMAGEVVRKRTDPLATAFFAAVVQAWTFSALFVTT